VGLLRVASNPKKGKTILPHNWYESIILWETICSTLVTSAQITLLLENAEIFKNYFSQRVCLEYSENILFPKQKFQTSLIIQQTCGEAAHTTVFLQN
jgi:hypothetical protein